MEVEDPEPVRVQALTVGEEEVEPQNADRATTADIARRSEPGTSAGS